MLLLVCLRFLFCGSFLRSALEDRTYPYIYIYTVGTIGVLAVLELLSFKYPRSTPEPKCAIDWLAEKFGRASVNILFIFLIGTSISGLTGQANAETEKDYLVFGDALNVAVIRIYGDRVLGIAFDPKTKVLTGQAIMKKLDKDI